MNWESEDDAVREAHVFPDDFSDVYTIEVYGLKGWEFANRTYHYRQAMDIFISYVNAGIEVRVTSPKEDVLRKRLGLKEIS